MRIKDRIIFLILVIVIALSFLMSILKPYQLTIVSGNSMYPTLHNGQWLFMEKGKINRNDIVTFNSRKAWDIPEDKDFIKRAVGLPGDEIKIYNNILYINQKEYVDFSELIASEIQNTTIKLKENEYFVVGDNVGSSHDSLFRLLQGEPEYIVKGNYLKYKKENIKRVENDQ